MFQTLRTLLTAILLCLGLPMASAWGACGSISGTASIPVDSPACVIINVFHDNQMLAGRGASNYDSTYIVSGLPSGTYRVQFDPINCLDTANNITFLAQWYLNQGGFSSATPVTPTATLSNVTIQPGGSISGTVSGVPGLAYVTLFTSTGTAVAETTTDIFKGYRFTGLPTGRYKVRFSLDQEGCSSVMWYKAGTDLSTADAVAVTASTETSAIDVTFPTGTVTGSVNTPCYVRVYDDATGYELTSTYAGTSYTLSLPAGSYHIRYEPLDKNYVTMWYNGRYTSSTADSVTVASGATVTANVILEAGGTITGTVTNLATGTPIAGAFASAYNSATGDLVATSALTGGTGLYTLQGLRVGQSYTIKFTKTSYLDQWYDNASNQSGARPVFVPATGINAALAPSSCSGTGGITVRVDDPCGNLTNLATVTVSNAAGQVFPATVKFVKDTKGNVTDIYFTSSCLPSDSYTLYVSDANYDGYIASASATVTAPGTTTLPTLTLAMGGSISGRVTDASGTGVAHAVVTIFDGAGNPVGSGAETDLSGNYVAGGLPTGSYRVFVSHSSCRGVDSGWYNNQALIPVTAPTGVTGIDTVILPVTFTIATSADTNGTITPTATVPYGSNSTVTVTADPTYHIASVIVDGISQSIPDPKLFTTTFSNVTASHMVSATFAVDSRAVSVTVAGTAPGRVVSTPQGIDCSTGTCLYQFDVTAAVTLSPQVTAGTSFSGWSGGGCSGTGLCTIPAGTTTISTTGTFVPATVKRGDSYFLKITDAYATAADGSTVNAVAQNFGESLTFDRGIGVSLVGGYSADFSGFAGTTTVQPPFIVKSGTVRVAQIVIR